MVRWSRRPCLVHNASVSLTRSGVILSRRRISAPALAAATALAGVEISTSIFRYRERCFARIMALSRETRARWLSLMRIPSERLMRCGSPPPSSTAFLSRSRIPGEVFLVAAIRVVAPVDARREASNRVRFATPLILPMMFKAVLSTRRIPLAGPSSDMIVVPAATSHPSWD